MAETLAIRTTERGSSRVAGGFERIGKSMDRVGKTGKRVADTISQNWAGLYSAGQRVVGLLNGMGAGISAKKVLEFDDALGQLQVETNKSTTYMMQLRASILATGAQYGVSKDQITAYIQVLQDQGGHFELAVRLMKRVTAVSKATGAEMTDLATIAAALKNSLNWDDQQILEYFARLNAQAISGTLNFKKMSKVAGELVGAAANTGQDVGKLGAMLQTVGNVFSGNQNKARTAILAMVDQLQQKAEKLKKTLGVDIFSGIDPKTGKKKMKDIEVILAEVFKKTGGNVAGKKGLAKIFSRSSLKAITALSGSFNFKTGRFEGQYRKSLDAYKNVQPGSIKKQLSIRQGGISAESERLKRAMASVEEKFQTLGKKLAVWISANLGKAAAIGVGGLAAWKLGPKVLGWLAGKIAGGAAGGAGSAFGVQKVWVVNMGAGGIGGAAPGSTAGGVAKALGAAAVGTAAYLGAKYADDKYNISGKAAEVAYQTNGGFIRTIGQGIKTRTEVREGGAAQQAMQFAKVLRIAQAQGRATFQYTGDKGKIETAAATQSGAAAALQAKISQAGGEISLTEAAKVLAAAIKIEVNAPGLDKPTAQVKRGTPQ